MQTYEITDYSQNGKKYIVNAHNIIDAIYKHLSHSSIDIVLRHRQLSNIYHIVDNFTDNQYDIVPINNIHQG